MKSSTRFQVAVATEQEPEIRPCSQCLLCVRNCPAGALSYRQRIWSVDLGLCHACGECAAICPNHLISER